MGGSSYSRGNFGGGKGGGEGEWNSRDREEKKRVFKENRVNPKDLGKKARGVGTTVWEFFSSDYKRIARPTVQRGGTGGILNGYWKEATNGWSKGPHHKTVEKSGGLERNKELETNGKKYYT